MTANSLKRIALTAFAQKGYDAASLQEIADGVGIKKPSIYAHFENKESLFLSVLEEVTADFVFHWRSLSETTAGESPEIRLRALFLGMIDYFTDDSEKIAFWVRAWVFPPTSLEATVLDCMKNAYIGFTHEIAAILREGVAAGTVREEHVDEMVTSFFALIHGYLIRVISFPEGHSGERAAYL